VQGVAAVALGGSLARGEGDASSDIDLGIYYRRAHPPSVAELRHVAADLDPSAGDAVVTALGAWGPWIDGGAWLEVDGVRVDWLYRDLDRVSEVLDACRAGDVTVHYQPGHPHGFWNHMYLGEVALARVLRDADGSLSTVRDELTAHYPPAMRAEIIRAGLWEAGFTLGVLPKVAERGDVAYVAGAGYRVVASLVQVLFALNERWLINEKGAGAAAGTLPIGPPCFADEVAVAFDLIRSDPASLRRAVEVLTQLASSVTDLASPQLPVTPPRDP
jgi:hypothetical protein